MTGGGNGGPEGAIEMAKKMFKYVNAEFDINKNFIGGNSMSEFSDGLALGANMNNNGYPCVPAYGNGMGNGWGDDPCVCLYGREWRMGRHRKLDRWY